MEHNTAVETNRSPTERRAWEAPRLTAVTPVDRTRGGTIVDIGEGGNYKTS